MTSSEAQMQSYYAARASEYDTIYLKPERQADLRAMGRWLQPHYADTTGLEIACGTGYWTQFVAAAESRVTFLVKGLGGRETCRTMPPDGQIANVQVQLGISTVMVSEATVKYKAMAAAYYFFVEDADAALALALKHGATLEMAVGDMPYRDRQGGVGNAHGSI